MIDKEGGPHPLKLIQIKYWFFGKISLEGGFADEEIEVCRGANRLCPATGRNGDPGG